MSVSQASVGLYVLQEAIALLVVKLNVGKLTFQNDVSGLTLTSWTPQQTLIASARSCL